MDMRELLNGAGSKVNADAVALAYAEFKFQSEDLLALCAAPQGSAVTGTMVSDWTGKLEDDEDVPLGLHITVKSTEHLAKGSQNEFVIFREPDPTKTSLYVKLVDFHPKHKGVGVHFEPDRHCGAKVVFHAAEAVCRRWAQGCGQT